jgi:hypothetical protein
MATTARPTSLRRSTLLTGFTATGNADLVPYRIDDSFDIKFEMSGADTPWVGLTAAQTNEFGYVDEFGTEFGTGVATNGFGFTGDGSAADPFLGATFNPDPTGSVVTFFLRSTAGSARTPSTPTRTRTRACSIT